VRCCSSRSVRCHLRARRLCGLGRGTDAGRGRSCSGGACPRCVRCVTDPPAALAEISHRRGRPLRGHAEGVERDSGSGRVTSACGTSRPLSAGSWLGHFNVVPVTLGGQSPRRDRVHVLDQSMLPALTRRGPTSTRSEIASTRLSSMPARQRSMALICSGDGSKWGSSGGANLLGRVSPSPALTRPLIASGRTGPSGCSAIDASMDRNNSCKNAVLICAASNSSSGVSGGRPRSRFAASFFEGDSVAGEVTWSRMYFDILVLRGLRSAPHWSARSADSSGVTEEMFERVYGHHHPDYQAKAVNALSHRVGPFDFALLSSTNELESACRLPGCAIDPLFARACASS